jgi:hypothetical protein
MRLYKKIFSFDASTNQFNMNEDPDCSCAVHTASYTFLQHLEVLATLLSHQIRMLQQLLGLSSSTHGHYQSISQNILMIEFV